MPRQEKTNTRERIEFKNSMKNYKNMHKTYWETLTTADMKSNENYSLRKTTQTTFNFTSILFPPNFVACVTRQFCSYSCSYDMSTDFYAKNFFAEENK